MITARAPAQGRPRAAGPAATPARPPRGRRARPRAGAGRPPVARPPCAKPADPRGRGRSAGPDAQSAS